MRLIALAIVAALAIQPTFAKAPPKHHIPTEEQVQDESQLVEHGSYVNKDGRTVHSPAHTKSGGKPAGATAKCRDGSWSFSKHHRGTCSRHGGVESWQ